MISGIIVRKLKCTLNNVSSLPDDSPANTVETGRAPSLHDDAANCLNCLNDDVITVANHTNQSNHTKITVQTTGAIKSRQSSESGLSELTEFSELYCSHSQFCSFSNSVNPDSDIHINQSNHPKITVQTKSVQTIETNYKQTK
jgi:hypothetical protein